MTTKRKTIIVTGASQGIGPAASYRFAQDSEQNSPVSKLLRAEVHTGREAGLTLDRLICDEVADNDCSSERHIGLLPPRHRDRNGAAAEDRAATWVGHGLAEVAGKVGGLIRQGFPLPVVLTSLCQHFDATVHGCFSSVLLLDRTGTRIRNAAASGLPASYMKQLEG